VDGVSLPYVLTLEGRDLQQKASKSLTACLGDLRSLQTLDLRNTKLQGQAHSVVMALRSCPLMQTLNLSRTRLRDEGAELLACGLVADDPETGRPRPHPSLQSLSLEECALTKASGPAVAAAALSLPMLEELFLAHNELGDESAASLAHNLTMRGAGFAGSRLWRLDLSETALSGRGLGLILAAVAQQGYLGSLDVGGNERIGGSLVAGSECTDEVLESLTAAVSLRDLHLWRCGLYDEVASLLVESLPPRLRLLNIAANPFSRELRRTLVRQKPPCAPFVSIRA